MNNQSKRAPILALIRFTQLLTLLALGGAAVRADVLPPAAVYAARVTSTSQYNWDSGFWWIPSGGTPFSLATLVGGCAGPARIGSYSHPVSTLAPGEGFGINLQADSTPGDGARVVYLVSAYVCAADLSPDVLVHLVSTNAAIGVYPGMGTADTCAALQIGNCQNRWGPVCYLTNDLGALHPEIEFHYVSGSTAHLYADCISFTPVWHSSPKPLWCELDGNGNMLIHYSDAPSLPVVLVQSFDPGVPRNAWLPVQTNASSVGTFTVPVSPAPAAFYRLRFQ